jgi:RNA polymerase-interacting CarD/CdnL/TRCF family regulator
MKEIENMELQATHSNGDWLVHQYYGVGQLKGKEIKNIGGEESFYFRLEMDNKSTIFIPEDKLNSEWFRPIASDNKLEEVKEILARPSKKMAQNFNIRKSRIKKVMTENSITGIARTVRDLSGRRKRRKTLSKTEDPPGTQGRLPARLAASARRWLRLRWRRHDGREGSGGSFHAPAARHGHDSPVHVCP